MRASGPCLLGCSAAAATLTALLALVLTLAQLLAPPAAPAAFGRAEPADIPQRARGTRAALEKVRATGLERALIDERIDEFRYADADEDGFLSAEETLDASVGEMSMADARAFVARADVDNDTRIDLEEWLPMDLSVGGAGRGGEGEGGEEGEGGDEEGGARGGARGGGLRGDARDLGTWLAESGLDLDGDGRLSKAEFDAAALSLPSAEASTFSAADADGDGFADVHELPALLVGAHALKGPAEPPQPLPLRAAPAPAEASGAAGEMIEPAT